VFKNVVGMRVLGQFATGETHLWGAVPYPDTNLGFVF